MTLPCRQPNIGRFLAVSHLNRFELRIEVKEEVGTPLRRWPRTIGTAAKIERHDAYGVIRSGLRVLFSTRIGHRERVRRENTKCGVDRDCDPVRWLGFL